MQCFSSLCMKKTKLHNDEGTESSAANFILIIAAKFLCNILFSAKKSWSARTALVGGKYDEGGGDGRMMG